MLAGDGMLVVDLVRGIDSVLECVKVLSASNRIDDMFSVDLRREFDVRDCAQLVRAVEVVIVNPEVAKV